MLSPCETCPWRCGVDRRHEASGECGAGWVPEVSSANLHNGEEPVLSGTRGSGTIFFTHCPLACRFCQNFPISQLGYGVRTTIAELADHMLRLEQRGAHNVNLVTPSHYAPQILAAAMVARRRGLAIPFVWNSNGFERVETLRLMEGVVDVYLPDLKYGDDGAAEKCSGAKDYWSVATAAIREMSRQVGSLRLDESGIAVRGLIIRHLVLPGGLAGTARVLDWIASSLPLGTKLSLMGQYFPAGGTTLDPPLDRKLDPAEYAEACDLLDRYPEIDGWTQDMSLPGNC